MARNRQKIDAVIVVEGKSDTRKLQQYFDVETFETSGTGLREDMLDVLEELAKTRELIVFTDPDVPGEQIRRMVMERIPTAKHAFIAKADAHSKNMRKLGVEHADYPAIADALARAHVSYTEDLVVEYSQQDMIQYQFVGFPHSKQLRDAAAAEFQLGEINAKQFLKRLNMFQIAREKLELWLENHK